MNKNLRENYRINQTAVEKSFNHQIGLKNNSEYEHWADEAGKELIKYFYSQYPGVKIEIPKMREKSKKSILGKIKNLEIERLSKLYAVEGISDEEKDEFYSLIEERIHENDELDIKDTLNVIRKIIYAKFNPNSIHDIEETIMVDGISKSTKTALLRILMSKIINSDETYEYKKDIIKYFNCEYGKIAAERSGLEENDIIRYQSIINIRKDQSKIQRLRDANSFLKANDLRGMKIIVSSIPDDIDTENQELRNIIEKRKNNKENETRQQYTHLGIVEIGKEFFAKLENNTELLKKLHMQVIPCSSRHKKKGNGYEAEHIKFINTDNPEFTLELQFKSEYVENMCRGEGEASHEHRPGKERILPHAQNDTDLIEKLRYMTPKYKTFQKVGSEIQVQKYNMLQNVMSYFQGQIAPGSEEYEEAIKLLTGIELREKVI
ncbi:MAG: hypothetical protein HFJ41_00035 [Clostridia bacterium]|nr:hypothetical protein [Clostridia bacterium]